MEKTFTAEMQKLYESAKAKLEAAKAEKQANLDAMRIEFAPKDGEEFDVTTRGDRIAKRGWDAWAAEVFRHIRPEDYCTAEECEAYHRVVDQLFEEQLAEMYGSYGES